MQQLSKMQKAAVEHKTGPATVYAGPGSGKTSVVTLRAAKLALSGNSVLVTTFTKDATEEMRARINELLPKHLSGSTFISTLHSLCLMVLKEEKVPFTLLTEVVQQRGLAELANATDLEGGVKAFLSRVSWCKNQGYTAAKYKNDGSEEDKEFARVWRKFEKLKAEKVLFDFDDLILKTRDLLETNEEVRARHASKFSHIIVDECQDMNTPQYAVTFALGRDHKSVMLVGDPDQSLYAFRGADSTTFHRFANHPDTVVYELRENYRSTGNIMRFADTLIKQDENRRDIPFVTTRSEGEPVIWDRFGDPDEEAIHTANRIEALKAKGVPYRDMAVLFRVNAQSEAFERIFAEREIPCTIRDESDFYSRREIQGIVSYLRYLSPSGHNGELHADEWLIALLNIPDRSISRAVIPQLNHLASLRSARIRDILPDFYAPDMKSHKGLRQLQNSLQQIESQVEQCKNAGEIIQLLRKVTDYDRWVLGDPRTVREQGGEEDRIQNLLRMQAAASHYQDAEAYLKAIEKVQEAKQRNKTKKARTEAVTLCTGHGAKGLEWKCVFAVGWSDSLLPHKRAEDLSEERRIAYVIASRARDILYVSSIDSWNNAPVSPSCFLLGLRNSLPELDTSSETEDISEAGSLLGGLFE